MPHKTKYVHGWEWPFLLNTEDRCYVLLAQSESDMQRWIRAYVSVLSFLCLYFYFIFIFLVFALSLFFFSFFFSFFLFPFSFSFFLFFLFVFILTLYGIDWRKALGWLGRRRRGCSCCGYGIKNERQRHCIPIRQRERILWIFAYSISLSENFETVIHIHQLMRVTCLTRRSSIAMTLLV